MAQRTQPNTDKLYIPNKGFFSELFRQLPLPDPMKLLIQALVVACLDGFVLGTGWLTTTPHTGCNRHHQDYEPILGSGILS